MDPRNKRAIRALRMTIEAAEAAIERIEEGLTVDHPAGALGTNVGVALFELGSYAARDHARSKVVEVVNAKTADPDDRIVSSVRAALTCHKCRNQVPAPHKGSGVRGTAPCPACGADEVYL